MTSATFQIRRATAADGDELARLRYAFRAEQSSPAEPRPQFVARCREWMTSRLAAGAGWRCWVAAVDRDLIGTLWLQLIEKLPNPADERELHGYITSVYVVPTHRNAGVGTALLTTCLNECDEVGIDAVFLWCTPESRLLYQRHGFAVHQDLLARRGLSPSPHS